MEFARRYVLWGAAVLGVWVLTLCFTTWRPVSQVRAHQEAFFRAVEDRKARRIDELLAPNYADQWGFDRTNVIRACDDFRRCFLSVGLVPTEPLVESHSGTGLYTACVRVQGSPTAVGAEIRRAANRLDAPFVFTWRRSGFLPWQWRLHRIHNEELTSLEGYEAGALSEMLDMP